MRQKRLKSQRTRVLEKTSERCNSRHPNWYGVQCEFSIYEFHNQHIGENGAYAWYEETTRPERRMLSA